jgi:hypothetical protein
MSLQSIPQAILSDELQQAIKGRPVKVAVFLTFQFDPGLFEEEILPVLFNQTFSHVPKIRLLQLEEALRGINHLAVYYDRAGLAADAKPARLDYRRVGLSRSSGCFHPKNIFLLLENNQDGKQWESLLIVTLSANLTRAGWWENVEVAHVEEVHAGDNCSFRQDVLDLITRLKREDKTASGHLALDAIRTYLSRQIGEVKQKTKSGRWRPRFYTGEQSVPEFLQQFILAGYNLEVISPYFDESDAALTLRSLLETLKPKATRLFLPEGKEGAALCREQYFAAVEDLPGVKWGRLPASLIRASGSEPNKQVPRFVHAKIYRFWNQDREIFFIGSVNLTQAAHQSGRGGNLETGMLVESPSPARLSWWLELLDGNKPAEFRPEKSEDEPIDELAGRLTLRFNWASGKLDYFWEKRRGSNPSRATVIAQGVTKFIIESIRFDQWVELPPAAAQAIQQLLKSTSLVEVRIESGASFRILIQEEGMAHKPSILLSLSAEEILQYWSLLSPEQREAFIDSRAADLAAGTETNLPLLKLAGGDSMFDRFAGIFHAFGRLEHHVNEALQAKRDNEAVYRLFGQKYDSLPSLIDKVAGDEHADRVNRYVTLLCARQVLQRLEKKYPDFHTQHQAEFHRLAEQLKIIDQVQAGFTFDTPAERQKFFDWFGRMFFMEIPVKEAQ